MWVYIALHCPSSFSLFIQLALFLPFFRFFFPLTFFSVLSFIPFLIHNSVSLSLSFHRRLRFYALFIFVSRVGLALVLLIAVEVTSVCISRSHFSLFFALLHESPPMFIVMVREILETSRYPLWPPLRESPNLIHSPRRMESEVDDKSSRSDNRPWWRRIQDYDYEFEPRLVFASLAVARIKFVSESLFFFLLLLIWDFINLTLNCHFAIRIILCNTVQYSAVQYNP